jgi:single-stranded-DNA-specific exonuclease
MKQRKIVEKVTESSDFIHSNPLLNKIYLNRGLKDSLELDYALSGLLPPWTMKGIDLATDLIIYHIKRKSKILIVGDYDCDGATSTTIAKEGLEMCGALNVEFIVPDRVKQGYGLSIPLVEAIASSEFGDASLMITVDNGISAFDGAKTVKKLMPDCQLLVTDHHLPPDESDGLPITDCLVNPNQRGCEFPSKALAGCGVIFYVMMALRSKMDAQDLFNELGIKRPDLRLLMDALALGTVADVVPLDKNNRLIIHNGISMMNKGNIRHGIKALLEIANKEVGQLVASDMGFAVGPRINAAGRMSDMSIGIRCLLSKTYDEAIDIARELDFLNKQRKEVELSMVQDANMSLEFEESAFGVVVRGENWHEGVVGIVASRIKDKANRPVICFTDAEPINGEAILKGSSRSIEGIHLKHLLGEIDNMDSEIMLGFGGHAMAAGLSIRERKYEKFKALFNSLVERHITKDIIDGLLTVDVKETPENWITLDNARTIKLGGPWGQQFLEPKFCGTFKIISFNILKDVHLKLVLQKGGSQFEAISFNCVKDGVVPFSGDVTIVFKLDVNRFRNKERLQLMIEHIQNVDELETNPLNDVVNVDVSSITNRKRNFEQLSSSEIQSNVINDILRRN